jgi:hypothetical protein
MARIQNVHDHRLRLPCPTDVNFLPPIGVYVYAVVIFIVVITRV